MGFNDACEAGDGRDAWQGRNRRRLREQLEPKCEELLGNAEAALTRTLTSIPELAGIKTMGTGSAPTAHDEAVARLVALHACTADGNATLEIFASVECYIDDDHLGFQRKPLTIVARRRYPGRTQNVKATFKRVRSSLGPTSYEFDEEALKEALRVAVNDLSAL